jgi:predicted ester cyclase
VTSDELNDFAACYAKAWCSHNPQSVAAFFAENGSLSVNDGPSAIGRPAIAEIAGQFMRDFSDLIVTFDALESRGDRTVFHWTLTGTYAGTGNHVRISGYELWKIGNNDLIAESKGHFDTTEYERQLKHGFES